MTLTRSQIKVQSIFILYKTCKQQDKKKPTKSSHVLVRSNVF